MMYAMTETNANRAIEAVDRAARVSTSAYQVEVNLKSAQVYALLAIADALRERRE